MTLGNLIMKQPNKPPVIVLYADAGAGKSTLGTTFPAPLFLDLDDGLRAFDVPRIPITNVDEFETALKAIEDEKKCEFKTVVIDTIDELENMLTGVICTEMKVKSLIGTKYGEGFTRRSERLNGYIDRIIALREKGIIPVFLCHSQIITISSPETADYNFRTIKLQKSAAAHLVEASDLVGFVGPTLLVDNNKNVMLDEERAVQIGYSPAHLSKARVVGAPAVLPMSGVAIVKLFARKE
jgi:hypothetical protein